MGNLIVYCTIFSGGGRAGGHLVLEKITSFKKNVCGKVLLKKKKQLQRRVN